MRKKLGLALGSGGARGVAHIGVLKALEEEGIKPDYISGCSMGAVVGACYAKGMTTDDMLDIVLKLKKSDLMDISAVPISKLALLKGHKLQRLLLKNIGDITFEELTTPFMCVASDLYSGRLVNLNSGSVAQAVQASSSIPTVFRPVEMDGHLLVDGGVLCRMPVRQLKDMGADVIIASDALAITGESVDEVPNIVSMILRVYDMMDYNATQMKSREEQDICNIWLAPEIKGMSQYIVKDFDRAYAEGYEYTKNRMDEIKALLQ